MKFLQLAMTISAAAVVAACGGGASSPMSVPTLQSIALSPTTVSLAPGSTQQLTVTGTYSDESSQLLAISGESFQSSNVGVATVSAGGVVMVVAGAAVGATAVISASDVASGIKALSGGSTVITVAAAAVSGGPSANSAAAALATAQNNAACAGAIAPFYWEIGDETGALSGGSVGTDPNGNPVLASTKLSIASASKWVYGTYVTQARGSAASLTSEDINFLHFTSGYTNMGNGATGSECPSTDSPDTVNACLGLLNASNQLPYSYQDPKTVGRFDYDGGHMENHASQLAGLGNTLVGSLGGPVAALLGNPNLVYTEPLMAGGIYTSGNDYALILRGILSDSLHMREALGSNAVCTQPSSNCNAVFSPIPEAWHYSIGHWVEDDPSTHGDGAFSSAGAFGFYPWIDASKTYYGIISREQQAQNGEQRGYASAQCGRLIRRAWISGVEQTGTVPD